MIECWLEAAGRYESSVVLASSDLCLSSAEIVVESEAGSGGDDENQLQATSHCISVYLELIEESKRNQVKLGYLHGCYLCTLTDRFS